MHMHYHMPVARQGQAALISLDKDGLFNIFVAVGGFPPGCSFFV